MKIKRAFTKLKKISEMPRNITMTGIDQMMRFYYHSSASLKEDNIELVCRELRILTHTIEKGMALPKIRKGFGKEKIKKILELMDKYISIQNSEYDQEAFDYAYAILEKYIDNATENECDISFIDLNKYHNYKKNQIEFCGTEIFDSQKLLSQIDSMNFEEFAKNRHSVRDFAVDTVDESIIRKAKKGKRLSPMPRTKGSKNRPKTNITKDYASQIAEKQEAIASLNTEIASITANIDTLKADLKEKKSALKKAEKEVASLEAKKAKAEAKAAEEAKKAEAEAVLKKLLASGMSADEILEKLK